MTRCTITVTRSTRRGGQAIVDLDGTRSAYTVTVATVRGVTEQHLAVAGVPRVGAVGDWLAETVPGLIARGRGVTAYDLETRAGVCRAEIVRAAA